MLWLKPQVCQVSALNTGHVCVCVCNDKDLSYDIPMTPHDSLNHTLSWTSVQHSLER